MTIVNISQRAECLAALHSELKQLEAQQIKVGEEMSVLIFKQMQLAEKCWLINQVMEKVICPTFEQ